VLRDLRCGQSICLAFTIGAVAGCASRHPVVIPSTATAAEAADSAMFVAIVERERKDNRGFLLKVRPSPLPNDPSITLAELADTSLAARRLREVRAGVLKRLGVTIVDTVMRGRCESASQPDCHPGPTLFLSISPARIGGAYLPATGIDDRESGRALGRLSMRVAELYVVPGAGGYAVWDYVFEPTGAGWKIVAKVDIEHVD
jgi:hypothetical protein